MNEDTGFKAFVYYIAIKQLHFKNSDFDITTRSIPKLKERLGKVWFESRKDKDGIWFERIENKYSNKHELIMLYSSYCLKNPFFYVKDILDDQATEFKKNIFEIKNIENVVINDLKKLISYCNEENVPIRSIFTSDNSIPTVFSLDLSFNSLVIFNQIFKILLTNKELYNNINIIEKELWERININLVKYQLILENYVNVNSLKTLVKNYLKSSHA